MKRTLQGLGLFVAVLLVLLVAFFFWGSSGVVPADQLATTDTYASEGAAPSDTLTVMTYNVGYLSGMTNNEAIDRTSPAYRSFYEDNMDRATSLLQQVSPDIVGFQEIDFGGSRAFGANQMRSLARRLNYRAGAEAVNWNKHYVPYPYGINPSVHFGRVVSGQGVLSRFPITDHRRVELARTSRPFWSDAFYLDRLAQITTLDVGRPLTVINVHLEAFEEATRETQAETVRQLYAEHAAEGPTLLIGDFNAVHPAAKNADRLSPSVARQFDGDQTIETILEGTNLQEALPDSLYRRPVAFTYPADGPNRKIDHIFYDPDTFTPVQGNVWCTPPSAPDNSPPSDHCAMVLRLAFRSDGGA